jgi:hypothetical protein
MPEGSEYGLRCFNELAHRTAMQMCRAVGMPVIGYPPDAFVETIEAEADRNGLLPNLRAAIERALSATLDGL